MKRTKPEKMWIGGGALGALVVAVAVWMFAVSPELSNADSLRSHTNDTRTQNVALQNNVGTLRAADANIAGLRKSRDTARAALPVDNALSAFTNELVALGKQTRVTITQVTAGDPLSAVATTAAAAPTDSASSSSSAAPAAPTATSAAGGLYAIPVTLAVLGKAADDLLFVDAMRRLGSRAVLINSTQMVAASSGGVAGAPSNSVTTTISLQVFVAPQAAAAPSPAATVLNPSPSATG